MYKYSERYGITNIRECKYSPEEFIAENKERERYIFDEVNGLKWEDKNQRMDYSYHTIDKLRRSNYREPLETPGGLNILFYLYTHLSNKQEIRHWYNQYRRFIYRQRLLPTTELPWIIWSKLQSGTLLSSLKNIAYGLMHR